MYDQQFFILFIQSVFKYINICLNNQNNEQIIIHRQQPKTKKKTHTVIDLHCE